MIGKVVPLELQKTPFKLYGLFVGIGIVLLGIVVYSLHLGLEIAGQYAVFVDAAKEIRYETTSANLQFERILRSRDSSKITTIWESRRRSESLNRALLEGGLFNKNKVSAIQDPELRGRLYDLLNKQENFYETLEDRWEIANNDGGGMRLERLTQFVYSDFVNSATGVEKRLKSVIGQKLDRYRILQYFMIILALLCMLGAGAALYIFVTGRERKNALLRESEDRFRTLLENARDMVLLIDSSNEAIIDVNSEVCRLLGYPREVILSKTLSELGIGEGLESRRKEENHFIPGQSFLWHTDIQTSDGDSFPIEAKVGVIEMNHKIYWLGIARDISKRKEMEEELILAKNDAEDANHAKSAFLANMSHEVRTPINGIMGMLQLMETTALDVEQEDYVNVAISSCRSLTSLLSDILDLSRIEAGKVEIENEAFALEDLMQSVSSFFRRQVEQDGISLTFETESNVPEQISGDAVRLRQVISNLVGNSVKFTEEGGILVKVESIGKDSDGNRQLLRFSVSDTGIGIPEDQMGHIFDAFRQVDGSYTRKHQGAGLGLSIVNKLVDLMDGTLSLKSKVGVGTTFTLVIPVGVDGEPFEEVIVSPKRVEEPYWGKRALVVDDHSVNLMSVSQLLNKMGIETSCACTGKEALALLQSKSFDFALMDIQMPEMDGISVTEEIRNNEIYCSQDLPIIAMTAHAMQGDRERFMAAGMNEYIAKPFEMVELRKRIDLVLEK